ncbi:MAG: hypothetical protein ABI693_20745 [Bryobacteraceae bacterium]
MIEAVTRDKNDGARVLSAVSRLSTVSPVAASQAAILPASGGGLQGMIPSLVQSAVGSGGTGGSGLASSLGSTLLSGFTLAPLISGLLSLFGGGGADSPQPLPKFALPPSIGRQEGISRATGSVPVETSYGQSGLSRAGAQSNQTPPQITIQVQAMDSRSFMDHSEAIAGAVREAMLHSHSLNDVVMEL